MKKLIKMQWVAGFLLPLFFLSCKEESKGPSGPLEMVNANLETGKYEVEVGGIMDVQFVASNRKKISYVDIDFYRQFSNKDKSQKITYPIDFQTIYNIPPGDTVHFYFSLPDTLMATPGEIEDGYVVDRISTQTRYKGGGDQSISFGVLIKEKED